MIDRIILGKMFRQIRKERKLTQEQVAFDIEQSSSGNSIISNAEKGKMAPDVMLRLVEYYDLLPPSVSEIKNTDAALDPKGNIDFVKLVIENYELHMKLDNMEKDK